MGAEMCGIYGWNNLASTMPRITDVIARLAMALQRITSRILWISLNVPHGPAASSLRAAVNVSIVPLICAANRIRNVGVGQRREPCVSRAHELTGLCTR